MFDKALAAAELENAAILLLHHLRQIHIHGDEATARQFQSRLRYLKEKSDECLRMVRKAKNVIS